MNARSAAWRAASASEGRDTAAITIGWLIVGRMPQPLDQMTRAVRRIADSPGAGPHERIALEGPQDEVKRLADAFDLMLGRLDHPFDGQRRFVANASHELRTPLTLNRALLEVAVPRRRATSWVRPCWRSTAGTSA